ncbi:hypothetical protein KLEP7_gp91 [Pseudaeromonas phage vB_PpeM_ KLEP7]|nr:hypothetical protein KLEP7_gp91 [Pseudaeromonas phage vB_PpeM_ KLEP7]
MGHVSITPSSLFWLCALSVVLIAVKMG